MYLKGRFIKPNHSTRAPGNLVFFDTETREKKLTEFPGKSLQVFRLGFARAFRLEKGKRRGVKEVELYRTDYFWDWLYGRSNPRRPTWCFAHNIGFDLRVLGFFEQLESGRIELYDEDDEREGAEGEPRAGRFSPIVILADLPTIIKCRWRADKSVLWFVDSGNYFRSSLESLARKWGLPYTPLPDHDAPLSAWMGRCRNDVDLCEQAILRLIGFVREHDLGVFKTTIAGQSYAAYRHRFMDYSILPHNDTECRKVEREAYHGGEVRVFFCGRVVSDLSQFPLQPVSPISPPTPMLAGPVHHLDCNSLYPSVMRDYDFPAQLCNRLDAANPDWLANLPAGVDAIARVCLDCRGSDYPFKYKNQLFHVSGRFRTTLAGPELRRAAMAGHIESVGVVQVYIVKPIFRRFVDTIYALRMKYREAGDRPFEQLCKLMLNSLHGKFGQWGSMLVPAPGCYPPFPYGVYHQRTVFHEGGDSDHEGRQGDGQSGGAVSRRVTRQMRAIAWKAFEVIEGVERDESFPAISAFVTAYGRERMRNYRAIAGARNVVYQDTDSLHALPEGRCRLELHGAIHPDRLGALKEERSANDSVYRGIKSYTYDGIRVEAGLKLDAEPMPGGAFRERQFQGLQESLSSQPAPGVIVTDAIKAPAQHDIRALVGPDGWTVPLERTWYEQS